MKKRDLLTSASGLIVPSEKAISAYAAMAGEMALLVTASLRDRPDLNALVGDGNMQMMQDNHLNHARFMTSFFRDFNTVVLVETILWVFRAYRAHGFKPTYWAAQLSSWVEAMRNRLPPEDFREIYPIYDWMIVNIPVFSKLSETPRKNVDVLD